MNNHICGSILSLCMLVVFSGCGGSSGGGGSTTEPPNAPNTCASAGDCVFIAADRNGDIYLIDPGAESATLVLDTFTDNGAGGTTDVGVVSSMLYFADSGVLWVGTGGKGFCGQCIHILDPATGDAVYLAGPDSGSGLAGLARNSNAEIYTIPGDVEDISSVDPVTGALSFIGAYGGDPAGNGMTFDLNDTFYIAGGEFVNEVTPATATLDISVPFNYVGFSPDPSTSPKIASMTTDPVDGTIYGLLREGPSTNNTTFLVTVAPVSGVITQVAELNVHLDGLVLVPVGFIP